MAKFAENDLDKSKVLGTCEAWAEDREEFPKCPRCEHELKVLATHRVATVIGAAEFNPELNCMENVVPERIVEDNNTDDVKTYICPNCMNPLFMSEDSAEDFFFEHFDEENI